MLGLVTSKGAHDVVFVSASAVSGALDVALRLSGLVLGFACSVLLFARGLPFRRPGDVADLYNI